MNYYNDFEPYVCQWLTNLAQADRIPAGYVDNRSIKEVTPDDVRNYTQAHFFAGIGTWAYALRLAGWPDTREVWTGSCPCQPFSAAGKRGGTDDIRHLWPEWFRLIRECRPPVIFGEQVASSDGLDWLDIVSADLESEGYAVAAVDLCAAGAGAPHLRQRLYFVAHASNIRRRKSEQLCEIHGKKERKQASFSQIDTNGFSSNSATGGMADTDRRQRERTQDEICAGRNLSDTGGILGDTRQSRLAGRVGLGEDDERQQQAIERTGGQPNFMGNANRQRCEESQSESETRRFSGNRQFVEASSFWSDLEWLPCRDGKARPTKPGLFPLAHGTSRRVAKLRAIGNAIVAPLAAEFIRAYMDLEVHNA